MALNFRIYCHKDKDSLHFDLMGDFDGSSAYELINTLKKYQGIARRIFIHTCLLSSVCSFGLDVFQKSCTIKKLARILTFTGQYAIQLAPKGSILLNPESNVFHGNDHRNYIQ